MKVLLLGNPESSHTVKWVRVLAAQGVSIYLLSLNKVNDDFFSDSPNVQVESIGLSNRFVMQRSTRFFKVVYLKILPKIKRTIKTFRPDILHAHYVSSYGVLGALAGFHPYIISIWGSDINRFPNGSWFNRWLVSYSLNRADVLLSTSKNMVRQIHKFTGSDVNITPFGIDMEAFRPSYSARKDENTFVIGTVKHLKKIYGIDVLIKAFANVVEWNPSVNLRLLIVGEGHERNRLENLARSLNLSHCIHFAGHVEQENVPEYINRMDVFAALSVYEESFGVSVLEAGACEKPVVVSDVSGFLEIVQNNHTGIVVRRKDVIQAAEAISKLVNDSTLRERLGRNARKNVEQYYSLQTSVEKLLSVYHKVVQPDGGRNDESV